MLLSAGPRLAADLTVAEIAERFHLAPSVAYRRVAFWIGHGVLADDGHGHISVVEVGGGGGGDGGESARAPMVGVVLDEEEDEDDEEDGDDAEDPSMYIVGMLGNQGPQSIEVIHSRLALFMQPYQQTVAQLQGVLTLMVQQDRLELRDGLYRVQRGAP